MEYKTILITGGAGFIGSHLTDTLIDCGYAIRVMDNLDPQVHPDKKLPNYFNKNAEFIKGDVTNRSDWLKVLQGVDAIVHFAAAVGVGQSMYEIEKYVKVNSYGTALLLDILANQKHSIKKIIVAASMSSYGEGLYRCSEHGFVQPPLRTDEQMAKHQWELICPQCRKILAAVPTNEDARQNTNSIYAIGKKNQEEMVLVFGKAYRIPAIALRFFNVYGPRQSLSNPYTGVTAIFMSRIKNNHAPIINEDGLQSRDFINVKDIVESVYCVLTSDKGNYEAFNVGSSMPTPIKEVAKVLIKLYKSKVTPEISYKFRTMDVRHCYADIIKITKTFGWKPKVSFEEGMKELIAWAAKENANDQVDKAMEELHKRGLR